MRYFDAMLRPSDTETILGERGGAGAISMVFGSPAAQSSK
jgi:hypothetical protein